MSKKVVLTALGAAMIVAGDAVVFYLIPPDALAYVAGVHAVLLMAFGVGVIGSAWERKF